MVKELPIAEYSVVKEPAFAALGSSGAAGLVSLPKLVVRLRARWLAGPKPNFACCEAGLPSRSLALRSFGEAKAGGEYRARTGDLLVANQALSQLS